LNRLPLLAAGAAALVILPGTARAANGSQLWAQAGCGGCHTLAAAGSNGQGGPNLDYLRPSSGSVAAQVSSGGGGMPSFGSSLTSADIQALALWVAQTAGGSATLGASSGATGMSASAVRKLQRHLKTLGYFHGPVTGFYGPLTTAAVKRFQRAAGLPVDGVWGPRSAAALRRRLSANS
jgi:mono/diheme cytochrome c family protein